MFFRIWFWSFDIFWFRSLFDFLRLLIIFLENTGVVERGGLGFFEYVGEVGFEVELLGNGGGWGGVVVVIGFKVVWRVFKELGKVMFFNCWNDGICEVLIMESEFDFFFNFWFLILIFGNMKIMSFFECVDYYGVDIYFMFIYNDVFIEVFRSRCCSGF